MKTRTYYYKGKAIYVEMVNFSTAFNGGLTRFHWYIKSGCSYQRVDKDYLRLL